MKNEQLGCGCRVYQKVLGITTWNRIDMCSLHYNAPEMLKALEALYPHVHEKDMERGELSPFKIAWLKAEDAIRKARGES